MQTADDDLLALRVDPDVCVGIGACAAAEPETFVFGDDGTSTVIVGARLPRDRAERVCAGCPSGAISIVD